MQQKCHKGVEFVVIDFLQQHIYLLNTNTLLSPMSIAFAILIIAWIGSGMLGIIVFRFVLEKYLKVYFSMLSFDCLNWLFLYLAKWWKLRFSLRITFSIFVNLSLLGPLDYQWVFVVDKQNLYTNTMLFVGYLWYNLYSNE